MLAISTSSLCIPFDLVSPHAVTRLWSASSACRAVDVIIAEMRGLKAKKRLDETCLARN
jgi:hypothetical protein